MDFDAILDLEGSFLREGSDEGIRDGKKSGLSSGYRIGLVKGREVGWEIGCYVGLCRVIEKQCQESPDHPLSRKFVFLPWTIHLRMSFVSCNHHHINILIS
eukprot:TRINITY_DN7508_c0_g1_i1.p1 TRINITY_DN7508_c0_g1~~TRINITY_DN7508_c0_g1_i1.p1  ORF type:complete len:101 (+),score=18.48 TRINITY_DN7508_c0_g1_i1:43-345(+)